MPCVVPNCDPKGQSFAVHFPQSYLLSQRWKQAIELGSGVALADDVNLLEAQVCQQHFSEFDEYSEPIIFVNNGGGGDAAASSSAVQEIHLSCCGLCLMFVHTDQTVSDWEKLTLEDQTVKDLLQSVFKIDTASSGMDYFGGIICQPCLVRLDLVAIVIRGFSQQASSFKKIESFLNVEKRTWVKFCSEDEPPQNDELQSPSVVSTIALEVELIDCKPVVDAEEELIQSKNVDQAPDEVLTESTQDLKSPGGNTTQAKKSGAEKPSMPHSSKIPSARKEIISKSGVEKQRKPYTFKDPNRRIKEKVYLRKLKSQKCYICVKVFDSSDDLRVHLLDHDETALVCKECNESCWDLITYNKHLAKHDCNERPFKCKHCYQRFATAQAKQKHEAIVHQDGEMPTYARSERAFTCQHCGKPLPNMVALQVHEDAHLGVKRFKCTICDKSFGNQTTLDRHHRTHTSNKEFRCKICGKAYRTSSRYEEHKASNCQPNVSNSCGFCSVGFKTHSELVDHTLRDHSNEPIQLLQCKTCDERFLHKRRFYLHVRRHNKILGKKHQCELCEKLFQSPVALKNHQLTHNQGDSFMCSFCPKRFTNTTNLLRHESNHRGEKNHQCDVCGKKFNLIYTLKAHKIIHTGERPFECKQCGKRFSDRSTLRKHTKNVCKE